MGEPDAETAHCGCGGGVIGELESGSGCRKIVGTVGWEQAVVEIAGVVLALGVLPGRIMAAEETGVKMARVSIVRILGVANISD